MSSTAYQPRAMKAGKPAAVLGATLVVLGFMVGSAAADPIIPGRDTSDVSDSNPSWISECNTGWRNSTAYTTCTTRGMRVDFTRTCTVDADCTDDDGGTKSVHHRGKASEVRTLVNCDGDLVRTACPPPPPPPDPPHPRDSVDVTSRLTTYDYQFLNATCLTGTSWQTAPFITYRNCWNVDIKYIFDVSVADLLAGRLCKVTATCRTFLTIAGLGRLANDLTSSMMVKAADIRNIYECNGGLNVGACPAGRQSTDRRGPIASR